MIAAFKLTIQHLLCQSRVQDSPRPRPSASGQPEGRLAAFQGEGTGVRESRDLGSSFGQRYTPHFGSEEGPGHQEPIGGDRLLEKGLGIEKRGLMAPADFLLALPLASTHTAPSWSWSAGC